ncbi:MAG: Ig-like domain-containing protein [Fibrobacter sp.]|nr:Ig-like domain-containing protein [Fibrobacter sp.]
MKFRTAAYCFWTVLAFACAGLIACATQVAPGGGPEDKLPPRIAAVYPAPGTTNHPNELYIKLEFDEWINPSIPRNAVSISPPIEKKMRFEVSGKTLELTSRGLLDTGTTYTVTFASGIKDLHGNALAKPFQVVFSTGAHIDSLKLSGRVMVLDSMTKKKLYPSVGLFLMGPEREGIRYLQKYRDTTTNLLDSLPMLAKEPPLYTTLVDSAGVFELTGLKPGRYRVATFLDVNGNQKIEPSVEPVGFWEKDIVLTEGMTDTLWIPLADQDTSYLELESVTQPFANILEATFTRPVYFDSLFRDTSNCSLTSNADGKKLFPSKVYLGASSKKPQFYFSEKPKKEVVYKFTCLAAKDSLFRPLDTLRNYVEWEWQEVAKDTLAPSVSSAKFTSRTKAVFPHDSLIISYDKPFGDSLTQAFYIAINKDTTLMQVEPIDPVRLLVKRNDEWPTDVAIEVLEGYNDTTLAAADSNGVRDTVITLKYKRLTRVESVSKLKLASLKGAVPGGNAQVAVRLTSIETKEARVAKCDGSGKFAFPDLEEGTFFIEYYYPEQSRNTPDAGKLAPFRFGQAWRAPSDTLKISKGENDLNKLIPNLPTLPKK